MKIALESFQYLSNHEHKKIVKNKKNISLTFVCFKLCFLFVSFIFFFHSALFCLVLKPWVGPLYGGGGRALDKHISIYNSIIWRGWEGIRQAHIHVQ